MNIVCYHSVSYRVFNEVFKSLKNENHSFSLDPNQFKEMVDAVRDAEKSLGKVSYKLKEKANKLSQLASRSLYIVKDVIEGDELTEDNVRSIRPGFGIHTKYLNEF
jgi:pseudaminic acid synthase